MNELDRLIFEDFIICFFNRESRLDDDYYRVYIAPINNYKDAFPEGEVCADLVGFNYIKEIN